MKFHKESKALWKGKDFYYAIARCGFVKHSFYLTEDWTKVTCKNCLKYEEEVMPMNGVEQNPRYMK